MTGFFHDLRLAGRTLLRSPWFSTLAILTLALGIGLNTALFSLVDAVLLRALPYHEPDRLVEISGHEGGRSSMRVPGQLVEALQQRSRTLQAIVIHGPSGATFRAADGPTDIRGDHVSVNFTDVLAVRPLHGRGFLPGEDRPGAPPVILVSHNFWQRHLGGDPATVGRILYLNDAAFTVIGIMPPEFRTQFSDRFRQDFWTTHVDERVRQFEREEGYELFARLAPGVTLAAAGNEVQSIAQSVQLDGWGAGRRQLGVVRLKHEVVRDSARALTLMLAAVAVVLIIVCSNLALLLLARADKRAGEFATRKAIGAGSAQLFRLALTESLLLALTGGIAGVALAYALLPALLALAPGEIPRIADSAVNLRALAVALAATLVTGCAFGLAPALRLSSIPLVQGMKHGSSRAAARSTWLRSALVSGQVAASLALCILAGLVGRTFLTLQPSDAGFDAKSIWVFSLYLPAPLYPTQADRARLYQEMVRRVSAQPGVSAVAFAENIPFSGDALSVPVREAGTAADDSVSTTADVRAVSANYHELLNIPLRRGRAFTAEDGANTRAVAIVNETLARRLARDGNVIGRRLSVGRPSAARDYEVVGVAADTRASSIDLDISNEVHIPYSQRANSFGFIVVRSTRDAGSLTRMLRTEVRAAAPALPLRDNMTVLSLEGMVNQSLAGARFSATLASGFSAIAIVLAAMGVFGLVAYAVSQRWQELGIRSALGARPRDLTIIAMRSALILTAIGVAAGLAAAAFFTRFIETQLYAIEPLDLPTFAGAGLLMLAVAVAAAAIPARQAGRVDPMSTLR